MGEALGNIPTGMASNCHFGKRPVARLDPMLARMFAKMYVCIDDFFIARPPGLYTGDFWHFSSAMLVRNLTI